MESDSRQGAEDKKFSLYNLFEEVQAMYRSGNVNPCYGYIDLSGQRPEDEIKDQVYYDAIYAKRMDEALVAVRDEIDQIAGLAESATPPQA